jgi:hypothetical protein
LESLFLFLLKFGSEGFSLLSECTGISFWEMGNQIPLFGDKGWTEETGVGEFKSENPRSPSSSHKAMSTYSAGLGSSTASRCSVSVVEDNHNQALNLEEPWQKKELQVLESTRPQLVTCVRGLSSPYTCIFMIWNLKPINTCSWLWYRSTCYSWVWWQVSAMGNWALYL